MSIGSIFVLTVYKIKNSIQNRASEMFITIRSLYPDLDLYKYSMTPKLSLNSSETVSLNGGVKYSALLDKNGIILYMSR
jgi:hypothetical protein